MKMTPSLVEASRSSVNEGSQGGESSALVTGASGDILYPPAKKVVRQRFAIALQYAAGAVLGLLLSIAFLLVALYGTTRG